MNTLKPQKFTLNIMVILLQCVLSVSNNLLFFAFQKISIPAPSNGNGSAGEATFHFSVNSNAEMEGPQVN